MSKFSIPPAPGQPGQGVTCVEPYRPWRAIRADIEAAETRVVLGLLVSTVSADHLAEIYDTIGDGVDLCDRDLRFLYQASLVLYQQSKPFSLTYANTQIEDGGGKLDRDILHWVNVATNIRAHEETVWGLQANARLLRNYFAEKRRLAESGEPIGDSGPAATDVGNGERFARRYRGHTRFCNDWNRWLVWDGRRWSMDRQGRVVELAKATARSILAEAAAETDKARRDELIEWAKFTESKSRLGAMINLAQSEPGIPVLPEELDLDPWAFNVLNGTLDLRTGELRPHRREDRITKLCPVEYDPNAECPLWLSTLETFLPNVEVRNYFQRLAGYCLTGVVHDHVFPIAHGTGSNGKTTLLGTLLDVFGADYALKCPHDFLVSSKGDSKHPTDRADLFGKRLVVAIETEDGARLTESLVKELTGGDEIRARRMREDFWSFKPTHKVWLATNHKPTIRGTDNGIWRRVSLIPFSVRMSADKAVRDMPERLKAEYAGILAWAVRGCLEWQRIGLNPPESVTAATAEYRSEEDVIGRFIEERCLQLSELSVQAGHLYDAYKAWAESSGFGVLNNTRFGKALVERGFEKTKSTYVVYRGIGLKTDHDTPTNGTPDSSDSRRQISGLNGKIATRERGYPGEVSGLSELSGSSGAAVPTEAEIGKSVASWPEARREAFLTRSLQHKAKGHSKEAADRMAFRELLSTN